MLVLYYYTVVAGWPGLSRGARGAAEEDPWGTWARWTAVSNLCVFLLSVAYSVEVRAAAKIARRRAARGAQRRATRGGVGRAVAPPAAARWAGPRALTGCARQVAYHLVWVWMRHKTEVARPGRHCHSTLSLTGIVWRSLGIYTVILLSLLSFYVKMTVLSWARRSGRASPSSQR